MRLSNQSVKHILSVFENHSVHGPLYLHGSRVFDNLRGGDIDLLIVCDSPEVLKQVYFLRETLLLALKELLDDQRIDMTIVTKQQVEEDPLYSHMLKKGIRLM